MGTYVAQAGFEPTTDPAYETGELPDCSTAQWPTIFSTDTILNAPVAGKVEA